MRPDMRKVWDGVGVRTITFLNYVKNKAHAGF